MEEQNYKHYLQSSPPSMDWMASNASGSLNNFGCDQLYNIAAGSGVSQWMHCQPTPQNYVQFLAEEIQKQMSYGVSAQFPCSGLGLPNHSQMEEYLRPHNCQDFVTSFTGLGQLGVEEQKLNQEFSPSFETYAQSCIAASNDPAKGNKKRSRERAYATDRIRRLRIAHWLDALQELVPTPEGAGQAVLMDGVIDHIKYLQYQMKDLCRNRLGDGSTSNSVIFLEEHGHYFVQDQMLNGPLEEMIGKLISAYPSAATELLQSRGLIVLPMKFSEGLLESMDMLDMQEKGEFLISK